MRQKHMTDSEPKEIKQDLKCKEEDEKITRSALASRQALKRWGGNQKTTLSKENCGSQKTNQLQERQNYEAKTFNRQ